MSSSTNSLIQIPQNGYRGQVIESASGLYFLGNGVRAYSAKLRQFYSRDPKTPFSGGSMNRYQYAELDPINFWDITGFDSRELLEEGKSEVTPAVTAVDDSFRSGMDISGLVKANLISFGWLIVTFALAVITGGSALALVLNIIGFFLVCISSVLTIIISQMEGSPVRRALEIIAFMLDGVGTIIALVGTAIGAIATRSGTYAAKLTTSFAKHTRIGRFIDRRTLLFIANGRRVPTIAITRVSSMREFPVGTEVIRLTTVRSSMSLARSTGSLSRSVNSVNSYSGSYLSARSSSTYASARSTLSSSISDYFREFSTLASVRL